MKLHRFLFAFLISLATFQFCFSQEIDFEGGNWFREIKGVDDYYTSYDFKFYSKDDVVKAKKRFNLIRQFPVKNEWEGIYTHGIELGAVELHWNSEGGFVYFYVYHTLRSLDFGSASNKTDSVKFVSEKSADTKFKSIFSTKLVKVKFGDRHFLVPENRLPDFIDRTVGLNTSLSDFNYYLQKSDELENKIFGLPVLPSNYSHFLRYPIEAKIISIGKKKIIPNMQSTKEYNFDDIHYPVTLNAGKNKNIKIGMNFFVEGLGEWIEITKVFQKNSSGKIRRSFGEGNQEECWDSEGSGGQIVPCKQIRIGMKVKTKVSESYF